MTRPLYAVTLTPEGAMRITRADGVPFDESDVAWLREELRNALRRKSLASTPIMQRSALIDKRLAEQDKLSPPAARFHVDVMILELEVERAKTGYTRTALAKALFVPAQRMHDYVRGWARPQLDMLRNWAFMLGWDIMLVPRALRHEIDAGIERWLKDRDSKIPEVE